MFHECLISFCIYFRIAYIRGDTYKAMKETIHFDSIIQEGSGGGAYVIFPYDIKTMFGKGRLKVYATFDGIEYMGSVVNMGVKNADGSVCYILGMLKDIRKKLSKSIGDTVHVTVNIIEKNP